jgi:DNA-binding response OmpR family regulator
MTAQHILLVEDEIKLARFIELELESEGRVNAPKWGMLRSIKTRIANSIVLIN